MKTTKNNKKGLPKGVTNNPNGRPPGTPNKITTDLRQEIKAFLDRNWPQVQEDFETMEPENRLVFIEKMMKYAVPSLSSVSMEASITDIAAKVAERFPFKIEDENGVQ